MITRLPISTERLSFVLVDVERWARSTGRYPPKSDD